MTELRLRVEDFRDADHWRWLLTDDQGTFLADHPVALDKAAPEYQGFARVLRRVLAGERGEQLLGGLDETDTQIVAEVLERLTHEQPEDGAQAPGE